MNPSNKEAAGSQPASPLPEQALGGAGGVETPADGPEQAASGAELAPASSSASSAAALAVPAASVPLPLPAMPAAPAPAQAVPAAGLPAEDRDVIEKEWVIRAKQIVERTKDDPYKQSEDLTLFKADYMKKRYGKTIKVSR